LVRVVLPDATERRVHCILGSVTCHETLTNSIQLLLEHAPIATSAIGPKLPMIRELTRKLVEFSGRYPWLVVLATLCFSALCWLEASHLKLRTDLLELLPRDSPGFRTFERQLNRLGGGATLLVIVESPDAAANHRFVDDLARNIQQEAQRCREGHTSCSGDACNHCGVAQVARVEAGTRPILDFFRRHRWLYVPIADLRELDERTDAAVAKASGLVADLDSEDEFEGRVHPGGDNRGLPARATRVLEAFVTRAERRFAEAESRLNPAPSGYFETNGGRSVGLRIVANSTALGDTAGDRLLASVKRILAETNPSRYHPSAVVGLAGDIPNSLAERESLASDALWATLAALALVLLGIALYFRSAWSLVIVGLPAVIGVGAAYAFATLTFGYVNTTGAFLGAIILGNGINYPIVLLSRYEEFVAAGQSPAQARVTAVHNAFRAELVGAAVASIAYGSLTVTRFRGFSQFGVIGCVGMVFVWCITIVLVPALLTLVQRRRDRSPSRKQKPSRTLAGGLAGHVIARFGWRWRVGILALASLSFVMALSPLPRFLQDPWEYRFNRLGARASKSGGAGTWSVKAERVFGGKTNVGGAMMLAESAEQAQTIKRQILAKDTADPQGRLVEDVVVVQDFIPGSLEHQNEKLAVLERILGRLTPRVLGELPPDLAMRVRNLIPSHELRPVSRETLPDMLSRQFMDRTGNVGAVFYVKYRNSVVLSDGRTLLRMAGLTDNVRLPDGTTVQTASRATVFAEMIRSLRRDGPLASLVSLGAVIVVVLIATHNALGALAVLSCLIWGVTIMLGGSALLGERLNFINFIAIPITLGIGCEYPFNIYDRSRLLAGDIRGAVARAGMAVALCSYTTVIGYSSLLFADNQALQSFGRMAVLGELSCVLGALFVLPALLIVVSKWRSAVPRS